MKRCVFALVVAGLVEPALALAAQVRVPELASAPFAIAPPRRPALARTAVAVVPALRLAWLDPTGIAAGTEFAVKPEVTRLLREMGIEATWRRGEPGELARPGELRVIFLSSRAQREHRATVLGATPTSFEGEPFVWVHVSSVRAAAGFGGRSDGPRLDPHSLRRLGIALGRVAAHEVVHVIAPTLPHGSGLMSARLDRGKLTASTISVDSRVGYAMRASLAGTAPLVSSRAGGAGDVLAAESAFGGPYR